MKPSYALLVALMWCLAWAPALAQETGMTDLERIASSPAWPVVLVILFFLDALRNQAKQRELEIQRVQAQQAMADAMAANATAIQRLADQIALCPGRGKE